MLSSRRHDAVEMMLIASNRTRFDKLPCARIYVEIPLSAHSEGKWSHVNMHLLNDTGMHEVIQRNWPAFKQYRTYAASKQRSCDLLWLDRAADGWQR
jgi:hypothetical protein